MGRGGSSTASPSSSEVFRQASSSQCEQEVDPSSVSQEGAQVSLQQLRSKVSLTDQQLENISNDFVRYVLFASFSKTPVRRDQIRAKVLKDYSSSSRGLYPYLLAAAQKTLADIFGFELKELPRKKGSSLLVLRNTFKVPDELKFLLKCDSQAPETGKVGEALQLR